MPAAATASFRWLPEELMSISGIILTVCAKTLAVPRIAGVPIHAAGPESILRRHYPAHAVLIS
jgi:hypothetical protein